MQKTKKKAISYIRFSTPKQAKGTSEQRQLELSIEYAKKNDLDLDLTVSYRDFGISAFKGKNLLEGALGKLLKSVGTPKIPIGSYLLVESLDRISRQNPLKALSTFNSILSSGLNIVTLHDNKMYSFNNDDDISSIFIMVGQAYRAHSESLLKSQRLRKGWKIKRENFLKNPKDKKYRITSRLPAWIIDKGKLPFGEDDDKVIVIEKIFEKSINGMGNGAICRWLNESDTPTFGKPRTSSLRARWHTSSIQKILSNRAVLGEYQPHIYIELRELIDLDEKKLKELNIELGDVKALNLDDEYINEYPHKSIRIKSGPVFRDYYPSIIENVVFEQCKIERNKRQIKGKGGTGSDYKNLFKGLVKCGYCGDVMRYEDKGKRPKGRQYLVCAATVNDNKCIKKKVSYEKLEDAFLEYLKQVDLAKIFESEGDIHKKKKRLDILKIDLYDIGQRIERILEKLMETDHEKSKAILNRKLKQAENKSTELSSEITIIVFSTSNNNKETSTKDKQQIKDAISIRKKDEPNKYSLRAHANSLLHDYVKEILIYSDGHIDDEGFDEKLNTYFFEIYYKNDSYQLVKPLYKKSELIGCAINKLFEGRLKTKTQEQINTKRAKIINALRKNKK